MTHRTPKLSLQQILLCGAAIVTLSMGIRHGFGLWLQPITQTQNWSRETFAFALAIQNLVWGFIGIFAGMLADRFGAFSHRWPRSLICTGFVGDGFRNLCFSLFTDHRGLDRHGAGGCHLRCGLRLVDMRSVAQRALFAAALLLAGVFGLYARPDFLLMLSDQIWGCF